MKLPGLKILTLAAVVAATSTMALAFDDNGKGGERHHMGGGKGFNRMMDKMREMDANKDGFIDKDEYVKNAEKRWSKMDKEGKGKVSLKEFEERHQARMKERMERMKEHSESKDKAGDMTESKGAPKE